MGNIFISYRREDSAGHSGRLFDKLRERFGKDRVFMDIAGIDPGVDFVEAIEKAVGSCDAFIVVIGKQWLSATDADGQRRLDNPEDFIRLEIAAAFSRNIRVIPVLVQGATAPSSGNLPEELKKLSRLQAHEISDNRWDFDVGTLIETLDKVLKKEVPKDKETEEHKLQPIPPSPPSKFPRWAMAVMVAIVIAIGVYALWPRGKPTIEMPNLVGAPFEEAKAILTQKGLAVWREERQTIEKPPGIVIDQRPKPGTEVERGQRVDLILAVKTGIKMPNVVGKRIEEAEGALLQAGLTISEVKEIKTSERSHGIVLDQNPGPGKEVEKGQRVELVVASEPTMEKERQREMARNLANGWFVAIKRHDVGTLIRMASLPFFFDNEVIGLPKDFEKKWEEMFSQMASKGEDFSAIQLREIKAQTIAEWRKEGYNVQGDRFLNRMEYQDGDFMISLLLQKGDRRHGQALYTRNVGGQIKLAGFWD